MLKAFFRWLVGPDAPQTHPTQQIRYIDREEFERELKKFAERTEWEMGEWFDKFSALHARTEKRINREKKKDQGGQGHELENGHAPAFRPSVLAYKRSPWSV